MGMNSVLPKQHAIKRFPLKGESVKGGSTVYALFCKLYSKEQKRTLW